MVQEAFPGATVDSVAVDSIYQDWTAKYAMDNGAATKELLNIFDTLAPGGRAAFNNSEAIPKAALALLERDAEYGKALGGTWDALQNLRQVIGEGPGWLDRLRRGVETGAILPAVGAAFLYQALDGDTSAELRNPDGVTPQNPGQVYGQGA